MIELVHSRSSMLGREIRGHIRLLSFSGKSLVSYFSSPYRVALVGLFSILFLPHVFVAVRDLAFATAYEVDPGSIIQSILSLFRNSYNMNAAYHSSYYGWTYYAITFVLVAPLYIARTLGALSDDGLLVMGIRFVFFLIGLSSVLAYHEVARRILKHALPAFAATLLFIAAPGAVYPYFYFLHPESTGLLFLFLGVMCLLQFRDGRGGDYRWYTLGLVCLVLSALSKQVFVVTSSLTLLSFGYLYCHYRGLPIWRWALSRHFARTLLASIGVAALVFFVVNPFAFIQPRTFIANQMVLFSTQTKGALFDVAAMARWLATMRAIPIVYLSIATLPFTLLGATLSRGDDEADRVLYTVGAVGSCLYVAAISVSARYTIQAGYLAPVYPWFVLNVAGIPLYLVRKWSGRSLRLLGMTVQAAFLSYVLIADASVSIPRGLARLRYKETLVYRAYTYIDETIPQGARVAHDHYVAIPSDRDISGCSYWVGCGTDFIEQFRPDYVLFVEDWTFSGQVTQETSRLAEYVGDNQFILIDTIEGRGSPEMAEKLVLSVWRKPSN